ncbi:MAG: hypothetical protein JKY02_02445 [Flavobacteriaceae bacterium]|nr:hypothetical protein [Flavobacteriaceae bacterium]
MNKSFFYCITIVMACCISCKKTIEKEVLIVNKSTVTESNTSDSCLTSDYKIYKATAFMWQKSWANEHNKTTSPKIRFSLDSLVKLRNMSTAAEGARLYYCYLTKQIPFRLLLW